MRRIIFFTILILILSVVGYTYFYYYKPYGDGERDGVLQKFSRKGDFFKTYEGEMIQLGFGPRGNTFNAQYFYFSVVDIELADSLEKCLGKRVRLHYVQYKRSLPWRGDNYNGKNEKNGQYIVDGISDVREADVSY